ncbi:MAG: alkaline phosphatase family protein [Thermoflavifilum sp.]|nr:alkaline phosphatase family protein [Thermoflavifilum sp.]
MNMNRVAVINVSGLGLDRISPFTPQLHAWLQRVSHAAIQSPFPSLSPIMQASFLTGSWPRSMELWVMDGMNQIMGSSLGKCLMEGSFSNLPFGIASNH